MALTFGFYNSLNGDRKYNAKQFGSIFDGVIHDGVYINIGNQLMVKATGTNMQVNIQTGRAWFNHTWTLNDTVYAITLPNAEPLLPKYVAVVLEVNETVSIRANSFKVVAGTPAANPQYPTLTNNQTIHQYPLAYVRINAGVTKITQANIINKVGTSDCPFVTSVAASMDIDALIARWETQWNERLASINNEWNTWFTSSQAEYNGFKTEYEGFRVSFRNFMQASDAEFRQFISDNEQAFLTFLNAKDDEFDAAIAAMQAEFGSFWEDFKEGMEEYLQAQEDIWENWFDHIQGQISEDAATNLQRQIDALAYAYVMYNRAVLGVTAFVVQNKVVYGSWGSVAGNKIIVARPAV